MSGCTRVTRGRLVDQKIEMYKKALQKVCTHTATERRQKAVTSNYQHLPKASCNMYVHLEIKQYRGTRQRLRERERGRDGVCGVEAG